MHSDRGQSFNRSAISCGLEDLVFSNTCDHLASNRRHVTKRETERNFARCRVGVFRVKVARSSSLVASLAAELNISVCCVRWDCLHVGRGTSGDTCWASHRHGALWDAGSHHCVGRWSALSVLFPRRQTVAVTRESSRGAGASAFSFSDSCWRCCCKRLRSHYHNGST